jgi:beta-phosphoglucomutase-like phosphatase (HAD superfamily)
MQHFSDFDPALIEVLLCDADGNLFPSEEPAFAASVAVTNSFLERLGLPGDCTAAELRVRTTGKNFRTTAVDLAVAGGVPVEAALGREHGNAVIASEDEIASGRALTSALLEDWVLRERDAVTSHLAVALHPDAGVGEPLENLNRRYSLAAVSSSASVRLDACFIATGLDGLIPADVRFSAEDSLPVPTSKPDPAVYRLAGNVLGIEGERGLAIEDSVPGVKSAVAAGFPTIGNVMFVPPAERVGRVRDLRDAGACAVINAWSELDDFLASSAGREAIVAQAHRPVSTGR